MSCSSSHKPPIFIRTLSTDERNALQAGLRSKDAFVLRRCQILLASSRGERAPQIAENLGCGSQTVRNAIHDFNERSLGALQAGSSRSKEVHAAFDEESAESLREMLHHQPSKFGKVSTLWTLAMAAEVSFEEGVTERQISGETIRATLARPGVCGERSKHWIEATIQSMPERRGSRSADPAGREPS